MSGHDPKSAKIGRYIVAFLGGTLVIGLVFAGILYGIAWLLGDGPNNEHPALAGFALGAIITIILLIFCPKKRWPRKG
jgi:hypothetical protein